MPAATIVHTLGSIEPAKTPHRTTTAYRSDPASVEMPYPYSPGRRKAGSYAEPRPDWLGLVNSTLNSCRHTSSNMHSLRYLHGSYSTDVKTNLSLLPAWALISFSSLRSGPKSYPNPTYVRIH